MKHRASFPMEWNGCPWQTRRRTIGRKWCARLSVRWTLTLRNATTLTCWHFCVRPWSLVEKERTIRKRGNALLYPLPMTFLDRPRNWTYPVCYFPSGPDGHLAPSYAISRLGPFAAASNCGRRHGGYTGWCGSENSRRRIVGEIISPLWLGRVRVRVMVGLELR